eukprot:3770820-Prymnesium_polylepis.1
MPLAASRSALRLHHTLFRRLLLLVETQLPELARSLFGQATGLHELHASYSAGEPAVNIYTAGGEFAPHTDNENLTVLIPLDLAGAFEGGGTAFWADSHHRPWSKGESVPNAADRSSWLPPAHVLKLRLGSALIFGGNVTHAGLPITSGIRHIYVASFSLKPSLAGRFA